MKTGNPAQTQNVRAARALVILCLLTLALCGASCKRSQVAGNSNDAGPSTAGETSTTPPFTTKEPERYQATIVTKGSLGESAKTQGMADSRASEMLVARDGEKRRLDVELLPGLKVTYLQQAGQTYMLAPGQKIYAEFKPGEMPGSSGQMKSSSPDFSPDKLLNQSAGGARYEKLGAEDVGGRATMKYRVTTTGEAKETTTETLIWVDEALGMPIKSETTNAGGSKYSTELRDIKQDVDASLFELPPDYRKVDQKELQQLLTSAATELLLHKDKD
jgi:hypothetical protein